MSFENGDLLNVEHRGRIYRAKIVDAEESRVKIHYVGWKSRWDEWIETSSTRIVVEAHGDGDEMDNVEEIELGTEQPRICAAGSGEQSLSDLERSLVGALDRAEGSSSSFEDGEIPPTANGNLGSKRKRDDLGSEERLRKRPSVQLEHPIELSPLLGVGLGSAQRECPQKIQAGSSSPLSVPVSSQTAVSPSSAAVLSVPRCALCSVVVDGRDIRCGGCGRSFHPEVLCLGVSESIIVSLLESSDGAIMYRCCQCRVGVGAGSEAGFAGAITQVLGIIGGIVAQVRALSEDLEGIRGSCGRVAAVRDSRPVSLETSVSEEVREVYEREKRKCSVILRGFGDVPVDQVHQLFREICDYLGVGSIALVNVLKLSPMLFRATISDSQQRFKILSEAKKLRFSDVFRKMYVQRDLTYKQRSELMARRSARSSGAIGMASGLSSGSVVSDLGVLGGGSGNRGSGSVGRGLGSGGGVGSGGRGFGSGGRGVGSRGRGVDSGGRGVGFGARGVGSGSRGVNSGGRGRGVGPRSNFLANPLVARGRGSRGRDSSFSSNYQRDSRNDHLNQ